MRLWRIDEGDRLTEVSAQSLELESRLEDWMEADISILQPDLLVIGRQVQTAFGGFVDLLCLDRDGDVVVVELKRDRTPRDITAQVLDYASWIRELSHEAVAEIADDYLGRERGSDLAKAFSTRFGENLPAIINGDHKLIVVASQIDPSSERIIQYLSDSFGVPVNAATFTYFKDDAGAEHLARVFLIQPDAVEHRSAQRSTSKRRPAPTFEEYDEIADRNGVAPLYSMALDGLRRHLRPEAMVTLVAFYANLDGGTRAICSLYPKDSSLEKGLHFTAYLWRLSRLLGVPVEVVKAALPESVEPWKFVSTSDEDQSGCAGHFTTTAEVESFLGLFSAATTSEGGG